MRRAAVRISRVSRRFQSSFKSQPIETIPPNLHRHLFNCDIPSTSAASDIPLLLPELRDSSLIEHFRLIADEQLNGYKQSLEHAAILNTDKCKLPAEWKIQTGWTRYSLTDGSVTQVPYPSENALFFDVETCVQRGQLPTLAVALSSEAWYGWCSELLVNDTPYPPFPQKDLLIPLGGLSEPRIAIGHNVGYDRARVAEPYSRQKHSLRFMDTMSMSIPMFGMADHQRTRFEMMDPNADEFYAGNRYGRKERDGWFETWQRRTCRNSLSAVHDHLFPLTLDSLGSDKNRSSKGEFQKFFVVESIEAIRRIVQDLFNYCANDVIMCAKVYSKLWPEFKERFPEPATLMGTLMMGSAYLPINQNWPKFYEANERSCEDKKTASARAVVTAATGILEQCTLDTTAAASWVPPGGFDPWLWPHNWSCPTKGATYPDWFYKLFKRRALAKLSVDEIMHTDVVMKSSLVPALFGMLYGPYPVYKSRKYGWGYIVPSQGQSKEQSTIAALSSEMAISQLTRLVKENILNLGDLPLPSEPKQRLGPFDFYQIPHPIGTGNLGDVLSKHFFGALEEKVLQPTRYHEQFEVLMESLKTTRFWINYNERFNSEVPIWYGDSGNPPQLGSIAPAIVPAGTVSRRSVHKLWVTLTNSSDESMIGVGIKSMVQAPPGQRLVGADVDSQEQWIAGLYGDASAAKALPPSLRHPGLTPFSNMMLAGSKSDGTDLHTVVAKQLNIKRGQAKTLNYARLYGSGEKHAATSLMQSGMEEKAAGKTARELFSITKGQSMEWFRLRKEVQPLLDEFIRSDPKNEICYLTVDGHYYLPDYVNRNNYFTMEFELWILDKIGYVGRDEMVSLLYEDYGQTVRLYYGGYESATFNFLEQQAARPDLRTPVLGCRLADSLAPLPEGTPDRDVFAGKYKRSVMNWLVQSSAVDFLHLLLVCMEWLCKEYEIPARFVISIHDEVRYLCDEDEATRLALALMLSNMYVRAYISQRVGIYQLPMSVAFFSQVDCDTVLRKEVDSRCVNLDGTPIPNGVAWTMDDLLKLTGGSLKKKE